MTEYTSGTPTTTMPRYIRNKALEICENHDRIHLRNTYYNYAKVY